MTLEIKTASLQPVRQTFANVARRLTPGGSFVVEAFFREDRVAGELRQAVDPVPGLEARQRKPARRPLPWKAPMQTRSIVSTRASV